MKMIVAADLNWGIGIRGDLLTPLPEDMKKKYMEKFKAPERFFMTAEGIKAVKLDTKNQKNDIRER